MHELGGVSAQLVSLDAVPRPLVLPDLLHHCLLPAGKPLRQIDRCRYLPQHNQHLLSYRQTVHTKQ